MALRKNLKESIFLLVWSFVVFVFIIKQGKVGCDSLLGECVNHAEH